MDLAFENAIAPKAHRCLGISLEPLTLGHIFLLLKFQPHFLDRGCESIGELAVAVLVCSQRWRTSAVDLKKWWIGPLVRFWGWRCRKLKLSEEATRFREYLDANLSPPAITTSLDDSRNPYTPWPFRILSLLTSDFHIGLQDALDMEISFAMCLWASKGDMEGKLKFWTDEKEEFWQAAHRMDLERLKN
jgi:hypothetical protein